MIGAILAGVYGDVAPQGDFESIATVTVGAGGSSEINFSSIPSTFQHLQIRILSRDNRAQTVNGCLLRLNADTTSSYAYHGLVGDGANASAFGVSSMAFGYTHTQPAANATSSRFAVAVVDVLDYANVNKNTTVRTLGGWDNNGSDGTIRLTSTLWNKTNAVTSISLYPEGSASFVQHTHFALYGIKG